MKTDTKGVEIKAGDLLKKIGMVQYADGLKKKISKKTWTVEPDAEGNITLPELAEDVEFLIVGNMETGLLPEFLPFQEGVITIDAGSVPVKYKVLKNVDKQGWKTGEVVQIIGKVSQETLENGFLVKVSDDTPHKHVLVVVDPIKAGLVANE